MIKNGHFCSGHSNIWRRRRRRVSDIYEYVKVYPYVSRLYRICHMVYFNYIINAWIFFSSYVQSVHFIVSRKTIIKPHFKMLRKISRSILVDVDESDRFIVWKFIKILEKFQGTALLYYASNKSKVILKISSRI